MKKFSGGQPNFKGVNAQVVASMSLFLQFLRDPKFSYLHLEAPGFEDFNLVFSDGKKIVCESKNWNREFNFSQLKKVLSSIIQKGTLGEDDEILIICTHLGSNLESITESARYFQDVRNDLLEKHKFSREQVALVSKVKYWKIPPDLNEKVVQSLFTELIGWVPQGDLDATIDHFLVQKIYKGSARGDTYSRQDMVKEIEEYKQNIIKKSGVLDRERERLELILNKLGIAIANNKSFVWADNQLAALSAQRDLLFFVISYLQKKKIKDLKSWDGLWRLLKSNSMSHNLLDIFKNNIETAGNRKYILNFLKNSIGEIRGFYGPDFFDVDVVRIIKSVINNDKTLASEAFKLVQQLISKQNQDIFYLKHSLSGDEWQKEQVTILLAEIFSNADSDLKQKVFDLITSTFNLIEDDGQHSHHVPESIFNVLELWLNEDVENRLLVLTRVLSGQFERYYKNIGSKIRFRGWEHMGGITSFSGGNYLVTDRHFIRFTLAPVLLKYYRESSNKDAAWKFIDDNCITQTHKVNQSRPDFLNRSAIQIILERYRDRDEKIYEEAKGILGEFILSNKGIPHKSDLIFQSLRGEEFSTDKKWALVKVTTEKYDAPLNPFVEQIVGDLAASGHQEALSILKKWSNNPAYFKRTNFPGNNLLRNISKLLQADFETAASQFEAFISNEYFIGGKNGVLDRFEAFEWARFLNDILLKDFEKGLAIIHKILNKELLSENEQILITACLYRIDDHPNDSAVQKRLFDEYVEPLLEKFGNNISSKFTYDNPREQIVQFVDKLLQDKSFPDRIEKALRIVRVFISDPDPRLPGQDPNDPENKYNEHQRIIDGEDTHSITSVRGWCAWILMKCGILEARNYIPEVIDLTEKLLHDPNYYVKHMACSSLSQLARIRLTVLPGEGEKKLFFGATTQEALENSKRVDKLAFDAFDEITKQSNNVKKVLGRSIIRVFDNIKTLNQAEAYHFISQLKMFPDVVVAEAAPLFIFYAEFRKNGYKDWRWKAKGFYDDLSPEQFNDQPFKEILTELIKSGNSEITSKFAWEFSHLLKELPSPTKDVSAYLEIIDRYYSIISENYDQHTFTSLYLFIRDNIENQFDLCYRLWKKCVDAERKALRKYVKSGETDKVFWWPFSYNGEILSAVYAHAGKEAFLESFEFLCDYPSGLNLGEIRPAVDLLKGFPKGDKKVETIFNKLIEHGSLFYNDKQAWLEKPNIPSP